MENKIYKPMSLEKEELIKGIASHINNSELPLFIIESILKELLMEVTVAAKQQAAEERAQYEQMLKEQSEQK